MVTGFSKVYFWTFKIDGDIGKFIDIHTLLVCLTVRLHPVETAEPMVPKFCVGPYMTPVKVYEW